MPSLLVNMLLGEIEDAQWRNVEELNKAWAKEIARDQKILDEINKRKLREAAEQAAIAQAIEHDLANRRAAVDALRIPEGVRVASPLIHAPSIAALNALIGEIDTANHQADGAQRSAIWAIRHGALPHPGDLARILDAVGADKEWAAQLHSHAAVLEDRTRFRTPQVALHVATTKLDACGQTVRLLDRYGADRTLRLIANPMSLRDLPSLPQNMRRNSGMSEAELDRVLDALFC
jgi:hypothetical protein